MAVYPISDAERLLGVKAHVLRYWEKEIPLIQPQKDLGGRRIYSSRDLRILMRLKHLLYVRRFTIEGAREQLYRELSGKDQDSRALLESIRSDLMDIFLLLHNTEKETPDADPISKA